MIDGFPKTAASAKFAFMKVVPLSPEELALKEKVRGGRGEQVMQNGGKGKERSSPFPRSMCMCGEVPSV